MSASVACLWNSLLLFSTMSVLICASRMGDGSASARIAAKPTETPRRGRAIAILPVNNRVAVKCGHYNARHATDDVPRRAARRVCHRAQHKVVFLRAPASVVFSFDASRSLVEAVLVEDDRNGAALGIDLDGDFARPRL